MHICKRLLPVSSRSQNTCLAISASARRSLHHGIPVSPRARASQLASTRPLLTLTASLFPASLREPAASAQAQCKRRLHDAAKIQHRAFIALGSNLGDRVAMIEQALRLMERDEDIRVLRTSSLWETKAMYVLEQDNFINGVCEIETSLSPINLLDKLQSVENDMGRVKVVEKGPRNIDLDILLYGRETVSTERLQIPHKLMLEREFVLRPLCELAPEDSVPPQALLPPGPFQIHLSKLASDQDPLSPLTPLTKFATPTPSLAPIHCHQSNRRTKIMSILNLTPDSFSDGGRHFGVDQSALAEVVRSHISAGAPIIDLGGYSTRPGAEEVSEEEELARVLPVVSLIRSMPEARDVAISIDTFRAGVARAAIEAGADMVNDVSAGLLDPAMLKTVADLGCTICLMHMRGTPSTMNALAHYPGDVITTIGDELLSRVQAAEDAGIRRWRIILDPGIGFAKNEQQNLEILRRLGELRRHPGIEGMPWLVGTSRKAFVGSVTGVRKADERVWGTAAAVAAAIQGGADIVRVHDVGEMGQVAKMADAVWRV